MVKLYLDQKNIMLTMKKINLKTGDVVEIVECAPISKKKTWQVKI